MGGGRYRKERKMNTTTVNVDSPRADLLYAFDNDLTYGDNLASALDLTTEAADALRIAIEIGDMEAAEDAAHDLRAAAAEVSSRAVWLADTAAALAEDDPRALAVVS